MYFYGLNKTEMNIAIVGYGKMGKAIESAATLRGHKIVARIDKNQVEELKKLQADVAIEFTQPECAVKNYKILFEKNIPVVSGTTGWLKQYKEVEDYCKQMNAGFFYASNFSIGVNILFHINKQLSKLMSDYQYNCNIEETHHIHKLDAPSGTAISLANDIINNNQQYVKWKLKQDATDNDLPILSLRKEEVPGTHKIIWESENDEITLSHSAKNRKGFASGAVLAAEFIFNKKGIFNMNDLLNL